MDTNEITKILQDEIETGILGPGIVLKQEMLAERFGVSRQPIRQVLERLLTHGLLTKRSDRSLAVNGLSAKEVRNLSQIRISLEAMALSLAIPHLVPRDLRKARRLNEDLQEEDSPSTIEELDIAFHQTLYAPCNNPRLVQMIMDLRREARRSYYRQPKGSWSRAAFYKEHEALLNACADGNVEHAVSILMTHIGITSGNLVQANDIGEP
ncbi:GntR family transcriptional regulator [Thalassospira alkalitolerans]|uniref:GntR family transcriptional regulator n=1 Tax=Thalassospira alkalitolerans TaxID=1293890 RepID=UPI003AA7E97C